MKYFASSYFPKHLLVTNSDTKCKCPGFPVTEQSFSLIGPLQPHVTLSDGFHSELIISGSLDVQVSFFHLEFFKSEFHKFNLSKVSFRLQQKLTWICFFLFWTLDLLFEFVVVYQNSCCHAGDTWIKLRTFPCFDQVIKVRNDWLLFAYWCPASVCRRAGPSEEILSWRRPDGLPVSISQPRRRLPVHSHTTQQPGSPMVYSHWPGLSVDSAFRFVDTKKCFVTVLDIHSLPSFSIFKNDVLVLGWLAMLKCLIKAFSPPWVTLYWNLLL